MDIKSKIIIFCAGKNGIKLMSLLGEKNVYFFCDNYKVGSIICGKRVIAFSELKRINQNLEYDIILSANIDAIRKQLKEEKIHYWEYYGSDNNFFNQENIKNIIDEELYNQYLKSDYYNGIIKKVENWFRESYISDINEQLVIAMKTGNNNLVSHILSYTYDKNDEQPLFEDEFFENRPGMRLIANLIEKNDKEINVCDLACGHGQFLREINSERINCYGVDVSVKRSQTLEKFGIKCKVGNLEQLEYKSDFFDYVTMMECLEHVSDPFVVMKEAYRVLKGAGGQIFVTVPYGTNCESPMHVRHFYEDDLYSIAVKSGYTDVKIMKLPYLNNTYKDNLFMSAIKK